MPILDQKEIYQPQRTLFQSEFLLEHPVEQREGTAANSDSRDEMMDEPLLGSSAHIHPPLSSPSVAKRKERREEDGSICETSAAAESKISTVRARPAIPMDSTWPSNAAARKRFSPLLQRNWRFAEQQIDVVARFKARHQEKYGGVKAARQHIAGTSHHRWLAPRTQLDRVARNTNTVPKQPTLQVDSGSPCCPDNNNPDENVEMLRDHDLADDVGAERKGERKSKRESYNRER